MHIIDLILYLLYWIPVSYLGFFAVASVFRKKEPAPSLQNARKFVILLPAYKEDGVIEESVQSCLDQDYPRDKFDIVVISDKMKEETNLRLLKLPIKLFRAVLDQSTKAKSLDFALQQLSGYDIAIVLDADNVIEKLYLQKVNAAFEAGYQIVQTHRSAKNTNTKFAILDAVSEEINNSIFRKGHYNVGMSAALIGSGMAFEFEHYKTLINNIKSIGGEDKELEHVVLLDRFKIHYLHHAEVLDEKIQRPADFANQRKRWLSAQLEILTRFLPEFTYAIRIKNIDFCDKVIQMAFPPRILLIGVLFILTAVTTLFAPELSLKWWILFVIFFTILGISVPKRLYTFELVKAISSIPYVFLLMFANLFKLKGAGKHFIHTPHGTIDK
ncbi:MAG: glycosyltransferase family 2 protein [Bacteroidales bacterium]|nr:glycosyltransferase family 2 protein [Bacteroidales bacterium]